MFFIVLGLVIIGLFIYGFYLLGLMFNNVAEGRWRIAALLPLALFDQSLFTEVGNNSRRRLLQVQFALLLLIGAIIIYVKS
jgi:hypothetical protein